MAEQQERGHRWFAALWDTMSAPGERRFGRQIRERLLGGLHGRVLETGAGTGHSFPYYRPEARVVATEPDPHMLRRAEQRLAELGLSNIEVRRADAQSLPFDDASFDHVVTTLVLCTVRDVPRALAEARRVLKPDGSFLFWEHVRNDNSRVWGTVQDVIAPAWRWCGAGCNPNRCTQQAIEDAGFAIEWMEERRIAPGTPAIYGVARPQ